MQLTVLSQIKALSLSFLVLDLGPQPSFDTFLEVQDEKLLLVKNLHLVE
jgi:hypothetical protein